MNPPNYGIPLAAALLAVLTACGNERPPFFQGYIEGEFLYLAAPQAGYLKSLDSPRGSRIKAGQVIFAVAADPDSQTLAVGMRAGRIVIREVDGGRRMREWMAPANSCDLLVFLPGGKQLVTGGGVLGRLWRDDTG